MSGSFRCRRSVEFLEVFEGGDIHLCCPGWVPRPLGNIFRDGLGDLWKGAEARKVRAAISRGEFSQCLECPYLPAPFGPVERADDSKPLECLDRIGRLTVAYDHLCNLRCPSCRRDVFRVSADSERKVRAVSRRLIDSGDLGLVDHLCLMGSGDPFASHLCRELMLDIPWQQYPILQVRLYSNGLLFDESHWRSLGVVAERTDEVIVSVDAATPETYSKNRGGDWDRLLANLSFIGGLRSSGALRTMECHFVVQSNNFREMGSFVDLCEGFGVDRIYFGKLRNWLAFTIGEHTSRTVHRPGHPEHAEFLGILDDERLRRSNVFMSNFGQLSSSGGW